MTIHPINSSSFFVAAMASQPGDAYAILTHTKGLSSLSYKVGFPPFRPLRWLMPHRAPHNCIFISDRSAPQIPSQNHGLLRLLCR